ncbi:hypothetical protein AKJ53_00900 [candidate division MSBL1 archaeon SCGC-AAA382F02]|uniref:Sulfatase N-terminal domain-containing protein n=1 Tax=candidate division MSBL1 archaeon SCGC-AAA382F02 TaxID=1698282 RepID=A0A133VIG7_9EURY|nr:hypothetical protein AKJ53_00900 [candidate division MSBL1 archaeon SCGC-AAA382F02]
MANKNVILITIDCLRADHVGCMGYDRPTTPNIDELAEDGALFNEAFSQGSKTATSFPALLTSTYPLMFKEYKRISEPRKMISEVLREHGYSTAAIHSNPSLSSFFNYDRGFDYFEDFLVSKKKESSDGSSRLQNQFRKIREKIMKKLEDLHFESKIFQKIRRTKVGKLLEKVLGAENVPNAEKINERFLKWVQEVKNENFFAWIHYMDIHMPLIPPKKFLRIFSDSFERLDSTGIKKKAQKGKLSGDEFENWMDLYDAEIRHVDSAVGEILEELEKLDILEETTVVITSDHGDEQLDHGGVGHVSRSLYDELIHVPLIIWDSEIEQARVNSLVELLDAAPTILEILEIEKPIEFVGESLIPILNGAGEGRERVISEFANSFENSEMVPPRNKKVSYRTKNWKLILDLDKEQNELYNLSSDPEEKENLYGVKEEKTNEIKSRILSHRNWEKEISEKISSKREKHKIKNRITKLDKDV